MKLSLKNQFKGQLSRERLQTWRYTANGLVIKVMAKRHNFAAACNVPTTGCCDAKVDTEQHLAKPVASLQRRNAFRKNSASAAPQLNVAINSSRTIEPCHDAGCHDSKTTVASTLAQGTSDSPHSVAYGVSILSTPAATRLLPPSRAGRQSVLSGDTRSKACTAAHQQHNNRRWRSSIRKRSLPLLQYCDSVAIYAPHERHRRRRLTFRIAPRVRFCCRNLFTKRLSLLIKLISISVTYLYECFRSLSLSLSLACQFSWKLLIVIVILGSDCISPS